MGPVRRAGSSPAPPANRWSLSAAGTRTARARVPRRLQSFDRRDPDRPDRAPRRRDPTVNTADSGARGRRARLWDDVVIRAIEHGLGRAGVPVRRLPAPAPRLTCKRARRGSVRHHHPVPAAGSAAAARCAGFPAASWASAIGPACSRHPGGLGGPSQKTAVLWNQSDASGAVAARGRLRRAERPRWMRSTASAPTRERSRRVLALRARKAMVLDAGDHHAWKRAVVLRRPWSLRLRAASRRRVRWRLVTLSGTGRRQAGTQPAGWWSARLRQGLSGRRPLTPAVAKTCACSDQPRRCRTRMCSRSAPAVRRSVFGITLTPEPVLVGCDFGAKRPGQAALWRSSGILGAPAPAIFGCREPLPRFKERTGPINRRLALAALGVRGVCAHRRLLAACSPNRSPKRSSRRRHRPPDVPAG